jgi:hypothetical protein
MKIDLLDKELNLKELQEAISRFSVLENKCPYLFMNVDTLDALEKQSNLKPLNMPNNIPSNSVICKYHGYKVYLNDSLMFGEVEIR